MAGPYSNLNNQQPNQHLESIKPNQFADTPYPYFFVLPPGLEPGTTDPKSVMISISPREQSIDTTPELGEWL